MSYMHNSFFFHLSLLSDWLMQIKTWEEEELDKAIDMEQIRVDPSPFQLVERTSLHKVTTEYSSPFYL